MTIFSKIISTVEVGIADLWSVFSKLGITPQEAQEAVVDVLNAGLAAAEAPLLHQLVAGYKEPAIVQNLIAAALQIPNLPADVKALLTDVPALATEAAANPDTGLTQFMATVSDIETKLGIVQGTTAAK